MILEGLKFSTPAGECWIRLFADKVFCVGWISAVPTTIISDDVLISSCTAARLIIAPVSVSESWATDGSAPGKISCSAIAQIGPGRQISRSPEGVQLAF